MRPVVFSSRAHRQSVALAAIVLLAAAAPAPVAAQGKFNKVLSVDAPAPAFTELEGIDGKRHALADYRHHDILVLYFTDNHCPASKMYEPRLKRLVDEFAKESVAIVAINVSHGPHETLEKMREHANRREWKFDYLRDPSQETGRDYGAVRTPQFFVLDRDRKVAYMGALDDRDDAAKVTRHYLQDAIRALLAGQRPSPAESLQRGCKIEYEKTGRQ